MINDNFYRICTLLGTKLRKPEAEMDQIKLTNTSKSLRFDETADTIHC